MGLRRWLTQRAVRRVHVFLAEAPGHFETRVAVERQLLGRGWVLAQSPADADALLVIGTPDTALQSAVDRVYDQLPGPRATAVVADESAIAQHLDRLRDDLLDERAQHIDARGRNAPADGNGDMHGEHDHMAPSGIALAEGGEDRDGLEMDRLHVTLGPVLPQWPAGLVLRCTMHGDTVMAHTVLAVPDAAPEPSGRVSAARRVDAVVDVLLLAGSTRAAERLRVLRDQCLETDADPSTTICTERDRLGRDRALRWSLGGTHTACLSLLDRALRDLAGSPAAFHEVTPLADLVDGHDLATVRLRISAAGPDLWHTLEVG